MQKLIGIIGSRTLPEEYRGKVREMVKYLLGKGYGIASGGAVGADAYALDALLELGQAHRGVIFSPWKHIIQFPDTVQPKIQKFLSEGGKVEWGHVELAAGRNAVVAGLLHRNIRLTKAVYGLVAYLHGSPEDPITPSAISPHKEGPVVYSIAETTHNCPLSRAGAGPPSTNLIGSSALRLDNILLRPPDIFLSDGTS